MNKSKIYWKKYNGILYTVYYIKKMPFKIDLNGIFFENHFREIPIYIQNPL